MSTMDRQIALALLQTFRPRTDVFARRLDDEVEVQRLNEFCRAKGRPDTWRVGNWRPVRKWLDDEQRSEDVPLTVDAVERHVRGEITIGFYPLRPDGSTATVSVDFDDHLGNARSAADPRADLDALAAACARRGVRFLANTSRGGAGFWLHLVLPPGVSAARARGVMLALVRDAGLRHITDGGAFDAVFPKQDDLRRKGPGNLYCVPVNGRWLRASTPGTHFLGTDPANLDAQFRALTEY